MVLPKVNVIEKTCATCCKRQDSGTNFFCCPEWKVDFSITLINQLNCEDTDIEWKEK